MLQFRGRQHEVHGGHWLAPIRMCKRGFFLFFLSLLPPHAQPVYGDERYCRNSERWDCRNHQGKGSLPALDETQCFRQEAGYLEKWEFAEKLGRKGSRPTVEH